MIMGGVRWYITNWEMLSSVQSQSTNDIFCKMIYFTMWKLIRVDAFIVFVKYENVS